MRRPALMSRASRGAARARVAGVGGRSRGATQTSSASRQKSIRRGTRGRAAGAARERRWLRGRGGQAKFALLGKIRVNGKDAHPLYSYLKVAAKASRLGGGA